MLAWAGGLFGDGHEGGLVEKKWRGDEHTRLEMLAGLTHKACSVGSINNIYSSSDMGRLIIDFPGNISTSTSWMGDTEVCGSPRMHPGHFLSIFVSGKLSWQLLSELPWNFEHILTVSSGCILILLWSLLSPTSTSTVSNTLVYDQTPKKVMVFPSASAVLSV